LRPASHSTTYYQPQTNHFTHCAESPTISTWLNPASSAKEQSGLAHLCISRLASQPRELASRFPVDFYILGRFPFGQTCLLLLSTKSTPVNRLQDSRDQPWYVFLRSWETVIVRWKPECKANRGTPDLASRPLPPQNCLMKKSQPTEMCLLYS